MEKGGKLFYFVFTITNKKLNEGNLGICFENHCESH